MGQRVEDRQAHVSDRKLGQDAAVHELDQGMDRGLRVDYNPDLLRGYVEQTAGLYDLEALVHQGGGIDRDAVAHLPRGMVQRLLDGDVGELGFGSVQNWAA